MTTICRAPRGRRDSANRGLQAGGGQGQQGGYGQGGPANYGAPAGGSADDPWRSPDQGGATSFGDEPPF